MRSFEQFNTWLLAHLWVVLLWVMVGFIILFLRLTVEGPIVLEVVNGCVMLWFMSPMVAAFIATRAK